MQITTIGLDIAKNVFQIHGINATEKVVVRKQLRRSQMLEFFKALPACLVGMEACATAHYWARELTKLGHQVRLMPAKDVKAYVKRNKNDAADAEAICQAVRRPTMRFVQVKSAEQQEAQAILDSVGRVQPKGGSHGKSRHLQRDGISGGMQDVQHPRHLDGVRGPPRQVQARVCGHGYQAGGGPRGRTAQASAEGGREQDVGLKHGAGT